MRPSDELRRRLTRRDERFVSKQEPWIVVSKDPLQAREYMGLWYALAAIAFVVLVQLVASRGEVADWFDQQVVRLVSEGLANVPVTTGDRNGLIQPGNAK